MPDRMDLRVIIVGSGRTGLQTARLLDDRGHDVVIIERNPDRVRDLVDERVATVIEGDATDSGILRQADLEGADVIVTMTDPMGTNFTAVRWQPKSIRTSGMRRSRVSSRRRTSTGPTSSRR